MTKLFIIASFVLVSIASADEPPKPRLSPETLSMLENRVTGLEDRVGEIEEKMGKTSTLTEREIYDLYDDHRYQVVEILLESPKLSLADAVELFVKRGGLKEKAKEQKPKKTIRVSTEKSVTRYSGPTWTWPGRLENHLATTHGIDTSGFDGSELRTIHDNLHSTGSSGIVQGTRRVTRPAQQSWRPAVRTISTGTFYQSCPGGVCPTYR